MIASHRSGLGMVGKCLAVLMVIGLLGLPQLAGPGVQKAQASNGHIGFNGTYGITKLIYPTLGNPAIIKHGDTFTLEFDPRAGDFNQSFGPFNDPLAAFTVTATTVATHHSAYVDYQRSEVLPTVSVTVGYSKKWPTLKQVELPDRRIYLVELGVPYNVPVRLYDLSVTASINGQNITDSEPHCFQAVDQYKDHFSYCQMSDVHVYGPENPDPLPGIYSHSRKERGQRTTNCTDTNGYGATYLHKEILQLNRTKPDFLIFTGDYDFGQRYWQQTDAQRGYGSYGTQTEYEFEQLWFYQELQELEVPVFMVIGNHDGYNEGSYAAHDEWFNNWTHLYGPLYFSFDYGQYHFDAINSMDWNAPLRQLTDYLGIIFQPTKYLGNVPGGGDLWNGGGVTTQAINNLNPSSFTRQLAWLRDDLAAHQTAQMRTLALHHDPWKDAGGGGMWASNGGGAGDFIGQITGQLDMGNGEGRLALLRLMRDYHVGLEISGHDHSDYYRDVDWSAYGGTGHSAMCNTTSAAFQGDTSSESYYPGYRKIWINDGAIEHTSYSTENATTSYSYPAYNGITPGSGSYNLGALSTPGIVSSITANLGLTDETWRTINHLTQDLDDPAGAVQGAYGAYTEFPMAIQNNHHYYTVAGTGTTYVQSYDSTVGTPHRVYQVRNDVPAGLTRDVRVYDSGAVDNAEPTGCSVQINGGAASTNSYNVALTLSATDAASGVREMMISNADNFAGGYWEPYNTTRDWTLKTLPPGNQTVHVKFRDNAMPANESAPVSDTIICNGALQPDGPKVISVEPSSGRRGENFYVTIRGDRTNFTMNECRATFAASGLFVGSTNITGTETAVAYLQVSGNTPIGGTSVNVINDITGETPAPLSNGFRVLDVAPTISSMAPTSGSAGDTVEITGAHFGASRGTSTVRFNGVRATGYVSWSDTDIKCKVPTGATTGNVTVVTESGPSNGIKFWMVKSNPPVSPSTNFYFAEGTCRPNFEPYICVQNPGSTDAAVTITYMKGDGTTKDQNLTVKKNSRSTMRVSDVLGQANDAAHDFSAKVSCINGQKIIAERPMYFNYMGSTSLNWTGGHDVVGATNPASTYYFAEGTCRPNFDPYICIQNPGSTDAAVTITYMKGDGTTQDQKITVKKNSRSTVKVTDVLGQGNDAAHDFSAKVSCTNGQSIIAERPMYFNYMGYTALNWTGGHDVVGATSPGANFYFAEGTCRPNFDPYICIQNPGSTDAAVTITYMKGDGTTQDQKITVKKNSRSTVKVTDVLGQGNDAAHDFSAKVSCTNGQSIIAERPMYFNYMGYTALNWTGGHDVVGLCSPGTTFYFAEGTCRPNFDPYICIQNPGSTDAAVTITYMKGDGTSQDQKITVKKNSRSTVKVTDVLGQGNDTAHDFSAKVSCINGQSIIAERPMYFNYNGWTGGHDVVGAMQ